MRTVNPDRPLKELPPTFTDVDAPFADLPCADPRVLYAANAAMRDALNEDMLTPLPTQAIIEA